MFATIFVVTVKLELGTRNLASLLKLNSQIQSLRVTSPVPQTTSWKPAIVQLSNVQVLLAFTLPVKIVSLVAQIVQLVNLTVAARLSP